MVCYPQLCLGRQSIIPDPPNSLKSNSITCHPLHHSLFVYYQGEHTIPIKGVTQYYQEEHVYSTHQEGHIVLSRGTYSTHQEGHIVISRGKHSTHQGGHIVLSRGTHSTHQEGHIIISRGTHSIHHGTCPGVHIWGLTIPIMITKCPSFT